jgi:tripartite ATP-independent transporter DctM subunit
MEAVMTTAPVMLIICASNVFSHYMTWENIPKQLASFIIGFTSNKIMFLLLCNIIFLIIGCFMDAMAAMIIVVPLLIPVVRHFGIDIIHFGLMMCFNVGLAAITPPFGTYIFFVSGALRIRASELIKELIPFLMVSIVVLILVTYVPWISTLVPNLMYGFQ